MIKRNKIDVYILQSSENEGGVFGMFSLLSSCTFL